MSALLKYGWDYDQIEAMDQPLMNITDILREKYEAKGKKRRKKDPINEVKIEYDES